jgi:hypothetical protein
MKDPLIRNQIRRCEAQTYLPDAVIHDTIFLFEVHLSPGIRELRLKRPPDCCDSMVFTTIAGLIQGVGCKVTHGGIKIHPIEGIEVGPDSLVQK